MAFQSPLISIPKKTTTDVDWTNPIRQIIAHSYGEDPNNYSEECSVLQRCRQDAVKGAGSDQTARDLLYKYFGQLELLELRFAEIKVAFPWNDAFTLKSTTQTSMAFEKASIIHLLASVLSSLAAGGSRADPEGVKRAYYNSRASAGMLTYINENFLHAPSTDLSREVVHLLIGIMMAQATEIFTEKLVEEKKAPGLAARSANSAAGMYNALVDEMKEFQGKGVFDRNWLYVLQIKAKLFGSLAQYYRSVADGAAGKHGASLVRMKLADTLAQDAQRQANNFNYTFISSATPSLPHDAASSFTEITKAHATLCSEAKDQAVKDNDLIYHDILPSEAALPAIEKLPAAAPITIQEVYTNPDVSKLIGPDIFIRLVPLAVHESASVYSEEKAKLVRAEVERVELNEGEVRAGLEHLGLPGIVSAWRKLVDDDDIGEGQVEVSSQVLRLAQEVERESGTENMLRNLDAEREKCERDLRRLAGLLDTESRECERMRAKYAPQFTQSPSGPQTSHLRSTIQSNLNSLSAAQTSDSNLRDLWREIQPDISILQRGESGIRQLAQQIAVGKQPAASSASMSLLDLQDEETPSKSGLDAKEQEDLTRAIADAQERLDRLGKIRRERDEVLKDLKDKVQNDDVSSLLLLNRRSQNVEPQLFASELEKFRPFQGRLAAAVQASNSIVQELEMLVRQVEKGKGVKERQKGSKEKQKRVKEWESKLNHSGEGWAEIQAGVGKGLSYYESLRGVVQDLEREVNDYVNRRDGERHRMVGEIETRQRISGTSSSSSPPPLPPHSSSSASGARGLDSQLAGLSLSSTRSYTSPPPPPPPATYGGSSTPGLPPPPPQPHSSTPAYPPPPPLQQQHKATGGSPYDFANLSSLPGAFSTSSPAPPTQPNYPVPPQRQSSVNYAQTSSTYAPPPSNAYPLSPPPSRPSQPPQPAYPNYPPSQQQSSHSSQPSYPSHPPPPPSTSSPYPPPPPGRTTSSTYPAYPSHPPPSSAHSPPPPPNGYPAYQPPQSQPPSGYSSPPPQQTYGYQQSAPPPPQQQQHQGQYGYQPPAQQQQQYGQYGQQPQQPQQQQQYQQGYQYR